MLRSVSNDFRRLETSLEMSFENLSVETAFLDMHAFVEVPSIVDILPSSLTTFSINEHFYIIYNIIYNLYKK